LTLRRLGADAHVERRREGACCGHGGADRVRSRSSSRCLLRRTGPENRYRSGPQAISERSRCEAVSAARGRPRARPALRASRPWRDREVRAGRATRPPRPPRAMRSDLHRTSAGPRHGCVEVSERLVRRHENEHPEALVEKGRPTGFEPVPRGSRPRMLPLHQSRHVFGHVRNGRLRS